MGRGREQPFFSKTRDAETSKARREYSNYTIIVLLYLFKTYLSYLINYFEYMYVTFDMY